MAASENLRALALEALLLIMEKKEYSNIVIKGVLDRYSYLPKNERAFLNYLIYGCVERAIELDYLIDQVSKVKTKKLKPVIRNILRMGAYQLKYMDAVPDRAAVSESVKLARKKGFASLAGYVNAVMRNLARNIGQISYPLDPSLNLSVAYSMPQWIVKTFADDYGYERTSDICRQLISPSRVCIRTNTLKILPSELEDRLKNQGISVEQSDLIKEAFYIEGFDNIAQIDEFKEGFFSVQDISSMQAVKTLSPKEGEIILDLCASPGGKATYACELMNNTGCVIARDISNSKIERIKENAQRCDINNIYIEVFDALDFDESLAGKVDGIIADLPCSGLGVIARKPDIKYHTLKEDIKSLAALQLKILNKCCDYLKKDGRIVYSTCTLTKEENADNVRRFLLAHPQFRLMSEKTIFPQGSVCDGFYIAYLKREE